MQSRVYWVTSVLMLVASTAAATTIVMPTDEQLIEKSPVIVRGTVISSTPVAQGNAIWTETLLAVEARIKGEDLPATLIIREAGGVLGDRITKIYGSPVYVPGERVLAFLAPHPRGWYQTMDLFAGKFGAATAPDGRKLWIRNEAEPHVDLLTPDYQPLPASTIHRDAERFETFVDDRVAGREGSRDYAVPAMKRTGLRAEANFTLIDEPTVYRWFAFDTGTRVSWRSSGTQPGYSGNGIEEVRTAMSSWTTYGDARILYSYDGGFTTAPGGLDRSNGINEILLNDPLSEIAGSFNRNTGGVVGRGGFNGVSSSRNWTSPFQADATHQGTFRAWNITEGNLVIQDGVSPSAGMSSNRLAEIIAHEFGHTLGFGHSGEATALMAATVTGIGPHLRDDDRLAARWLYPSGSSTPTQPVVTIPNAPGNLTATASGTTVQLQWSDNAANESKQTVYYAAATGSFQEAGDVAANERSVAVTGFTDGTWRFYVTASNSAGESTPSNTATVTISTKPAIPLVASFTWSPASPVADDPVSFTDTSTGGVTSRLWNFGDGTTSTQATPVKRYTMAGTYTVTLTVYRGGESRVASRSIAIAARTPALPPVETYRSVVPVSAQSEGVAGSQWRTELTLFNAGTEGVTADLIFVPGTGSGVQNRSVFVSPRQAVTYANALRDVFGMSAGSGAIAIEATGATITPQLKVTSRTFNDAAGGTYGLAVPDIVTGELQTTLFVAGMTTNSQYRTNVGLVNRGTVAMVAALTLYASDGSILATANAVLPANSFRQEALGTLFPAVDKRDLANMSMRVVVGASNALSVYASVVDNLTHDPLYVGGMPQPARDAAIIPVVGRGPGANGTFWSSDVTLFNPTNSAASTVLTYRNRQRVVSLAPFQTVVIGDILGNLGVDSGIGMLTIDGRAIVTSRNYTPAPDGGTFGQSIDAAPAFTSSTYVTGLHNDGSFRANLGFVNADNEGATVTVTLFTANGAEAGRTSVQVQGRDMIQTSVASLFPGLTGQFTLRAESSNSAMFAYGSVVDNGSGDPVFIAGR
ncbi:MAG TPA: PKD domain-containing protein [Thermoanaerobaculia bacterium]|nr:PKD domain-containing protein [Thermoanaerobaculia bacterium]